MGYQWRIYIVKFWTRAPPWGSKFFQFHAVFRKIWQNRMLAPPPGELAPPPREILDPPLDTSTFLKLPVIEILKSVGNI